MAEAGSSGLAREAAPVARHPRAGHPELAPAALTRAAARPARPRRALARPVLFAALPLMLAIGGYEYVAGGRIMTSDNAYVQAQSLGVSTDVSGTVDSVEVRDNQHVRRGQVLFRLRAAPFSIALEGAEAQLGAVRNQILTLQASYGQSLSQIAQARADLPYYEVAFRRQRDLLSSSTASRAVFDQAQHDLVATTQRVAVAEAQARIMLAQLGNDASQPVEQNPFYLQAKSAVDNARRDLDDTVVRAPFDGVVTNVDALQVGSTLKASQPGFSLISDTNLWVEANPKETELTYVRPGQPATVSVDTYPGIVWHGTVESISPASGSSFALLPAENTTGNWVKVVQRIPMRIRLDRMTAPPLRVGMSAVVGIDTGHARGVPRFLGRWLDSFGLHA